ncbi:MAG: hypothetical protein ACXQS4_02555 [Methermicoccaceae archaeon]
MTGTVEHDELILKVVDSRYTVLDEVLKAQYRHTDLSRWVIYYESIIPFERSKVELEYIDVLLRCALTAPDRHDRDEYTIAVICEPELTTWRDVVRRLKLYRLHMRERAGYVRNLAGVIATYSHIEDDALKYMLEQEYIHIITFER